MLMLRKTLFVFLIMLLTACTAQIETHSDNTESGTGAESQVEIFEPTKQQPGQVESEKPISVKNIQPSKLEQLITGEYIITDPVIVPIDNFAEMSYLVLVKEAAMQFNDGGDYWYEYALLGGFCNTYENGKAYYDEINSQYKKTQLVPNYEEIEERYGKGYMQQFYERNVTAFSADGERVLLKTYIAPFRAIEVLYEVYKGEQILRPFIYEDTIFSKQYNYTKNLQFFTVDDGDSPNINIEEVLPFYKSYHYYMAIGPSVYEDKRTFSLSKTTDKNDTVYYALKSNENSGLCIGIFSIPDNELIFQSDPVNPNDSGQYPDKVIPKSVTILDDKLIVGYSSNAIKPENQLFYMDYLDYFEIDMETNAVNYLCTNGVGSFSPDGKYLAYAPRFYEGTEAQQVYYIYCTETGETAFIPTGKTGMSSFERNKNNIVCWAHKDGLASLLEQ